MTDIAKRYVSVQEQSEKTWREVRTVSQRHGVNWKWLDEHEVAARFTGAAEQSFEHIAPGASLDWPAILAGKDLVDAEVLRQVMGLVKQGGGEH